MSTFSDFNLSQPLNDVLAEIGYEQPTPVQAKAIPLVLEGKDVLATAQTGTGKTAAFALPLISKMLGGWKKQVLIVAPTRELAEQIGEVLVQLTSKTPHLRTAVIIGGLAYHRQIRALRAKPAFIVGTPGRLIDQGKQGNLNLDNVGALVMDEADRMLDMGFEPQMNEIVAHLPAERQSLMFSATLPEEITRLAHSYLREPVRVSVGAVSKPIDKIKQDVIKLRAGDKDQVLVDEIDKVAGSVIIFTKTKFKAEKLAKFLEGVGHEVTRIHGDRSQSQRSSAMKDFRSGKARIMVATDIAARGIDVPHIAHVVNYDLPMCPEDYVHRIGRTARAGAEGHSIAFVTPEETIKWARIHKLIYGRYPDETPRGKNIHAAAGRPDRAQRRSRDDRGSERREGKFRPGRKDFRKSAKPHTSASPRREQELRAEQFLKDERRSHHKTARPERSERPAHAERPHRTEHKPTDKGSAKHRFLKKLFGGGEEKSSGARREEGNSGNAAHAGATARAHAHKGGSKKPGGFKHAGGFKKKFAGGPQRGKPRHAGGSSRPARAERP